MGDEKKTARAPLAATYGGPVDGHSEPVDVVGTGRNLEAVTPLGFEPEWDPYVHRKQGVGLQPIAGVLRNDRTPLNTPYTPQLMKMHLKRHEEYEEMDEFEDRPGKQLVTSIKSKVMLVIQPVHKIRSSGDGAGANVHSRIDAVWQGAPVVVWYFTAVVCVPFVMLVSPMLIAFSICASPIWLSGIIVLFVRALMRSHPPLDDAYSITSEDDEESSPHHPNSVYRRAHLTTNHGRRFG